MATSPTFGWTTPDGSTSPPDVAGWLASLASDIDATLEGRVLYGPAGTIPTSLAPGQIWCGI